MIGSTFVEHMHHSCGAYCLTIAWTAHVNALMKKKSSLFSVAHHVLLSVDKLESEIVGFFQSEMFENLVQQYLTGSLGLEGEREGGKASTSHYVRPLACSKHKHAV